MLKATRDELRELLDSSPEAMVIVDGTGKIVEFNKQMEKLFGYRAKELKSANLDILLPEKFRKQHAKHLRQYFKKAVIRPMCTGMDLYGCRNDGAEFPVEINLHPFETEEGTLVYAAIKDITKYKKTQADLRKSEIRLKTIIDNMPAAVFLRDSEGRFILVNKAYETMHGISNTDAKGNTLHDVFPEEVARAYDTHDARVIESKDVILEEAPVKSAKGEIILSSSKFPILDDDGILTGVAGVEYDVTQHKRAVSELKAAEEELRERSNFFRMLGRTAEHANTAATFEEAIQSFLTDVCMFTGWPVGHAYVRASEGADRLVPTRIWHMDDPDKFSSFRKVTEKTDFDSGFGLPGRVLASGGPEWITDVTVDANFPRAKPAIATGLRAAFAIPVLVGTEVVAVLEFYATEPLEPDESLLMTFMQAGAQLGQVAERSRAEKALRESQELLDTMLDNIPAHIFLRDLEGRYRFINARYAQVYGVTREQVVGKDIDAVLPKKMADRLLEHDKKVISEGCVVEHDVFLEGDQGDRVFAANKFPVFDASGNVSAVGGFALDVTEHRQSEAALRQNEKRLQSIMESSPIGATIVNADGTFEFVNSRMARMVGRTKEEFLASNARDFYVNPADRDKVTERLLKEGRLRDVELEMKKSDGTPFWILLSFEETESGGGRQFFGWVYDITERRRAEEALAKQTAALEESQQNLQFAVETANAGMWELDIATNELCWSPEAAEIFGYPHARVDKALKYFTKGVHRDDYAEAARARAAHIEGKAERYLATYRFNRPEGRQIWIRATGRVAQGGSGSPDKLIGAVQDVTVEKEAEEALLNAKEQAETALAELRKTQKQLVQSQKMASLGQLTAGIAHEIKNPLNFVNNFAETSVELVEELSEEVSAVRDRMEKESRENVDDLFETLIGDIGKINEHGRRADGIVKSMLLHARGDGSDRVDTELNPLVSEALNLAYHGERAKDKSFQVTLEEKPDKTAGTAAVMPQEITRVLVNLFGNSFYAVRKRSQETGGENYQPTVSVTTGSRGDGVEIRVRDNGTGIPNDVREKLFEPFFTTKPPGEGTGLGLSMCYDIIVQQHGGQMAVESTPGEFTEFRILLPRHAGDGIADERQSGDGMA